MGNILTSVKEYIFRRRKQKSDYSLSQPDHPERIPVCNLTKIDQSANNSISSSVSAPTIKTTTPANVCSQFYIACRSNDIKSVKKLLPTMDHDDIDRIEPNGSTALHAACYHGHHEIVQLLLEKGADRAIHNNYGCVPYDEAKNDRIRELFFRTPNSNRLISETGTIEWELFDGDVLNNAIQERLVIKSLYDHVTKTSAPDIMFEKIEKNYIDKSLKNVKNVENIRHFFRKATLNQDPTWIIKAYTAETEFYRVLNAEIAMGATRNQLERKYIIALLSHHPRLESLAYIGTAYRVMTVNIDDLKKYQTGHCLMTKSFLSSSVERKVAELFLCQQEESNAHNTMMSRKKLDGGIIKSWVMCKYTIKHRRTALHIEEQSQYTHEAEVLIMPYSVFTVKRTQEIRNSPISKGASMFEIELEECESY